MVISAIADMLACGRRRERTAAPSGPAREPRSNEEQEVSGRASTLQEQTRLSDAGQVETAATAHEESSDTVELASAGTAELVAVGRGNAVSHIKTWRRAVIASVAHDASGQPQLTVRFGHGDCLTAEASHFEVEDQYLLERSGLGGGDASHRAPCLETERADKHREGEPAMADLAGVRAASPKRGERADQESGERAQQEQAGLEG